MAPRGVNTRKFDVLIVGCIAYIALSCLLLLGFTFLAGMINDPNGPVSTFWGPLSMANCCCAGPWLLILAAALGISRSQYIKVQRKAVLSSQKADASRSDPIKSAESDLEVWDQIVQLKEAYVPGRIEAVRWLRCHDTPAVDEELTKAMLGDGDLNVRYEAFLALKFQGKDRVDLLLDRLKAEGDTKAKLDMLNLLRMTRDERPVATLAYLYGFETDKAVKLSILDSLDKFTSTQIRDLAISIMRREDDKDVRLKALKILCSYGDVGTQDVLKHLLDDPDPDVRDMVNKALASNDALEYLPGSNGRMQ